MLRSKILKVKYLIKTNLATNTIQNAKINEVKNKITNFSNWPTTSTTTTTTATTTTTTTTTTTLAAVENKRPIVGNLVKNLTLTQKLMKFGKKSTDQDNSKYITTQEFNKLTSKIFLQD